MKKTLWLPGILTFLLSVPLTTHQAHSQELKIGFVDYYAILDQMPEMRAVEQRMQNFYRDKLSELEVKEREIYTAFEDYQTRAAVLSDAARQREEQRLNELSMELRQFQNEIQQQLQQRRMQLMRPLFEQLQDSIDRVARQRGLDFVMQTTTSAGDSFILWVAPEVRQQYDITNEVLQSMDII
jgi:outer membrane protein